MWPWRCLGSYRQGHKEKVTTQRNKSPIGPLQAWRATEGGGVNTCKTGAGGT